ncbi:MAG: methylthioribulose 1-phosphate dehydratase [Microscillaceae bacterium]|nr:methylthioribulose 1-phosphate dehydratase [Microscillaceae bacterium]
MNPNIETLQEELITVIHIFNSNGWSQATSTNYSFRNPDQTDTYTITSSGKDKSQVWTDDLMVVDREGKAVEGYTHIKPSAETLLHTVLYAANPQIHAILHTHSIQGTILSMLHASDKQVKITGFELLKGIQGITSHEAEVIVPIFANSQDIPALSQEIKTYYDAHPEMTGFLLAGHGFYTWGSSIAEAKRHMEAYEFLFECMIKLHQLRGDFWKGN